MSDTKTPKRPPIMGYQTDTNLNNGFRWVRLHYTADPTKRSDEWKRKAKFGMTDKAWNTEMELCWETYAGEPVYGKEFSPEFHVQSGLTPNVDYPFLLRGWDFGGNHSCVVAQYLAGTLYVLKEYANVGYNTRRIATEIKEDCYLRFGQAFRYIDIIDPSGMWEGKTSDGKACGDIMRELGMDLVPGIQDVSRRIDGVMKLLITLNNGRPKLQVDSTCKMLINGFMGGYHYPEKETKNQKRNKPEKNEYSHIHDALQYVATQLDSLGGADDYEIEIMNFGGLNVKL